MLYTPRAIASSSPPPVKTNWPFLALTIAVPVSWHIGSTPPAAMFAFFSRSRATKRSLSLASGSSRMLRSCCRWPGRRKMGDVAHRLLREQGERLRRDLQERAGGRVDRRHAIGGDQPVRRVSGPSGSSSVNSNSGMSQSRATDAQPSSGSRQAPVGSSAVRDQRLLRRRRRRSRDGSRPSATRSGRSTMRDVGAERDSGRSIGSAAGSRGEPATSSSRLRSRAAPVGPVVAVRTAGRRCSTPTAPISTQAPAPAPARRCAPGGRRPRRTPAAAASRPCTRSAKFAANSMPKPPR